nr:MAG: terminase large subunit [Caudoviricetes sp.]
MTPRPTDLSFGPALADWVGRHMDIDLMPWQRIALDGQLASKDNGDLVFRESLVSTARQQGKSVALRALAGWFLAAEATRRGRPVNVLLVANKLERSIPLFRELAIFLEDRYEAQVRWANGTQQITMPDRSTFRVAAARDNVHGMTLDLILVDEIWDIAPSVVYDALRPSMIAVKNPLLSMWSTAGDQGSTLMLGLREQAISAIDSGKPGRLFFAEWSPPPGINPDDRRQWIFSNPALGTTVTWDALEAAAEGGDRASFLRAHLNLWVAATKSWLPAGTWEKLAIDTIPAGGVLSVDNSVDDSRYVGVRAVAEGNQIKVKLEFIVNNLADCWEQVSEIMAEPTVHLTVTPGLEALMPTELQRRSSIVGYGELLKYTQIVRSMILEGRLRHDGSNALAEHITRAVAVKTQNSIVLSSQKSPGPIELARCMVWAAAIAARPTNRTKPAFGFG